jgi:hypothetical protein
MNISAMKWQHLGRVDAAAPKKSLSGAGLIAAVMRLVVAANVGVMVLWIFAREHV